jgi:serine/threonine-protein kinase RsbW
MSGSAPPPLTITRPATLDGLPDLLAALDDALTHAGCDDAVQFALHLATEEAAVNVITHGYAGQAPGPLTLAIGITDRSATVSLTDAAPVFDPASVPAPDLASDAMDRPIGGLGWHMIHETVDEVRHEAVAGGGNRLTLIKHRPESPA